MEFLGLSDKLLGIAVEESVAMKLVAAAPGDDVEDAAPGKSFHYEGK